MIILNYRIWQVSIIPQDKTEREYHFFSSLSKATVFVKNHVWNFIEEEGFPPVHSMNIKVYKRSKKPKIIDGKEFEQWLKEKIKLQNKAKMENRK